MANGDRTLRSLRCPSCGALVGSDAAEQYFCEYCGSPLPAAGQSTGAPPAGPELLDWREEEAGLPGWLQETTQGVARQDRRPERRVELRPARPTMSQREAPRRRAGAGTGAILAIAILAGLLCLAVWILVAVFSSRSQTPAAVRQASEVVVVPAQKPWQHTGIRLGDGDIVSIVYLDGAWGVLGGASSQQNQVGPEGYEADYRAVGVPHSSAPVGSLLGRIDEGAPFLVGSKTRFRVGESGVLRLMINDQGLYDNTGALRIRVEVVSEP